MKTVIIPVFDGAIARNLFRTDVLETLKRNGNKVVIIPPTGKAEYYEKEFADNVSVFVEKRTFWKHDRLEFLITGLFLQSIPTNFMRIRQVDWYWHRRKYMHYIGASVLRFLGSFRVWRAALRLFDSLLPIPAHVSEVFATWQPDVVFAPTMIPRDEVALMRLAASRGKKTIGMVKSWDNLTSKAFLRFFPDHIIVHNEIVKREAETIYNYPSERIFVSGIPQFDDYKSADFIYEKEEFFSMLGADPNKRLILYAPAGDWMNPYDKETLKIILDWIENGTVSNAQVLLRLHPSYHSAAEELEGNPHLIIDRPGKHLWGDLKSSFEFDKEDMRRLASSVCYSAVTINTASTMTIEAAILDRPIILVGFDGEHMLSYWQSVIRYYDREHYVPIISSGGAQLVKSRDELLKIISDYLHNPRLDNEGRKRIVAEQCVAIDGRSGERIGKFISDVAHARL
jgi:hypothetical protein